MHDNDDNMDSRDGRSDSGRRRGGGGGGAGGPGGPGGPGGRSKRSPNFSGEEAPSFDYKDPQQLKYFISDRGKITPRRVSGLSAKQQRALTLAVKRARNLALLPYTTSK